jgi:hypothetical protein
MSVEIRQHVPGKDDTRDFVDAAFEVFRGDPAWVAPLRMMMNDKLSPKADPFYEHGEVVLFTARKDGKLVGRCSASIDRGWLDLYEDETGHFGYFDTIDDREVAHALLDAAQAWLREKGMKRMNGPMSFNANQELGLLIDGFEHPPQLDMGHSRPWQAALCESWGLTKEKDVFAWRYGAEQELNARVTKAWNEIKALPEVKLRSVNKRRMREELEIIMSIYNETWSGKWGFVPLTKKELDKVASDMSLVLDPNIAFIAEIDGKPGGMCIMIPNLNEAIADLNGSLFPFGWVKLLWRTQVNHPKSARLILLGVREQYRKNVKRYGGLSAAMYAEVRSRGKEKGYEWAELGWTREDDAPINLGIRSMGAKIYKTYRVYEKRL